MRFNTKTRRKRMRLRDSLRLRLTSDDKRNEQRNRQTNNATIPFWCLCGGKPRAFTLLEMVVAIAILAMVTFFAGGIFKSGIESYRTAMAQAEIMGKLRAITQQLDSDFKGLRKDAPLFIWFQKGTNADDANRFDQVMFFADGDFQSTQTYDFDNNPANPSYGYKIPSPTGSPIVSNVARIYYGQARSIDPRDKLLKYPYLLRDSDRILARRQHLFTADTDFVNWPDLASFISSFDTVSNDAYEHDRISLSQWQALANDPASGSANVDQIITACFGVNCPKIDFADANTLHLLMTEGVGSFSVQWGYYYAHTLPSGDIATDYLWWPSNDPNGDGDIGDSDFAQMMAPEFGFYFYTTDPPLPTSSYWFPSGGATGLHYPGGIGSDNLLSDKPVYPQALKFTFTLYDSRGVFKNGQTFTHIVYLGD